MPRLLVRLGASPGPQAYLLADPTLSVTLPSPAYKIAAPQSHEIFKFEARDSAHLPPRIWETNRSSQLVNFWLKRGARRTLLRPVLAGLLAAPLMNSHAAKVTALGVAVLGFVDGHAGTAGLKPRRLWWRRILRLGVLESGTLEQAES